MAETRAVRAVVRAHILDTSLSKRKVAKVLPLGGWFTGIGVTVLARAK